MVQLLIYHINNTILSDIFTIPGKDNTFAKFNTTCDICIDLAMERLNYYCLSLVNGCFSDVARRDGSPQVCV